MTTKEKITMVNQLRNKVDTVKRELKATTYMAWRNAREVLEDELIATNNQSLEYLIKY